MMLLNHLKSQNFTAPIVQESRNGEYVLEIKNSDEEALYVTLMNWIDGKVLSKPTDIQIINMGRLLAQLHNASESFTPKENQQFPMWGIESFHKNMKKLKQYHSSFLSENGWKTYLSVADKIVAELENVKKSSQNYGIIHGDFHMENIIFRENAAFPIDFGRCGYGYFLYDIASAILGLSWQCRKKFIEGYVSLRELEVGYEQLLETMFVKVMIENYCHHCSDPHETEGLIAEQSYAQAYMQVYLKGHSFLFESLQL